MTQLQLTINPITSNVTHYVPINRKKHKNYYFYSNNFLSKSEHLTQMYQHKDTKNIEIGNQR